MSTLCTSPRPTAKPRPTVPWAGQRAWPVRPLVGQRRPEILWANLTESVVSWPELQQGRRERFQPQCRQWSSCRPLLWPQFAMGTPGSLCRRCVRSWRRRCRRLWRRRCSNLKQSGSRSFSKSRSRCSRCSRKIRDGTNASWMIVWFCHDFFKMGIKNWDDFFFKWE